MLHLIMLALLSQPPSAEYAIPEERSSNATRTASPSDPIGLARIEDLAEENSPIFRRATARIEAARGQQIQAGLYPNPRLDSGNPQTLSGSSSVYTGGITQPIVTAGKRQLDRQAATIGLEQASLGFVQDRFQLLTNVRQQFYAVMAAERRIEVYRELMGITRKGLDAAQNLKNAGEGTYTDVLLMQTELKRAEVAEQNARTLLLGQQRQLAALIGLPDFIVSDVAGSLMDPLPTYDDEQIRQFVVSQTAEVQIAQLDVARNQVLLRRARAQVVPNVDVTAGYQYSVSSPNNQAVVGAIFPIPTWDRNQGNIRTARANISDASESRILLQNDLLRRAADASARFQAARDMAERIGRDILPIAKQTQDAIRIGYSKGVFDISRLLQADRALAEASLSYIDALEAAWKAASEIAGLLQQETFP